MFLGVRKHPIVFQQHLYVMQDLGLYIMQPPLVTILWFQPLLSFQYFSKFQASMDRIQLFFQ